jgi:hypothetical protein
MQCTKCNHFNDANTGFCTQCGAGIGKKKCPKGHVIAAGLSECPYCPKKTVMVAPPAATPKAGGRKGTMVVNSADLPGTGSPTPMVKSTVAALPPTPAAPKGRGKTMVVSPGQTPSPKSATPAPNLGGRVANTGASPLAGFLVSTSTDPNGIFWPLRFGRTSIGSANDNEVCLNFPDISGVHAMVNIRSNKDVLKIWISDNNSMNGTSVNGDDIFNDRPDLNAGDLIQIGGIEMKVVLV